MLLNVSKYRSSPFLGSGKGFRINAVYAQVCPPRRLQSNKGPPQAPGNNHIFCLECRRLAAWNHFQSVTARSGSGRKGLPVRVD